MILWILWIQPILKGLTVGRKKILIIDDEKLILKTTALLLQRSGMDVTTATDGIEGMAMAEKEIPDVILLDIIMPGMDGWSVLSHFKADSRLSGVPVVVFSGGDQPDSDRLAKERGASAVCGKPFNADDLIKIIDGLSEGKVHGH
jgi:CheY-like chemotaxis protein